MVNLRVSGTSFNNKMFLTLIYQNGNIGTFTKQGIAQI